MFPSALFNHNGPTIGSYFLNVSTAVTEATGSDMVAQDQRMNQINVPSGTSIRYPEPIVDAGDQSASYIQGVATIQGVEHTIFFLKSLANF